MTINTREIIKQALQSGIEWKGGTYPSRTIIDYSGEATVDHEGVTYTVKGIRCGGQWYEGMWLDGADGGISIMSQYLQHPILLTGTPKALARFESI
jgi:hypothetical protein